MRKEEFSLTAALAPLAQPPLGLLYYGTSRFWGQKSGTDGTIRSLGQKSLGRADVSSYCTVSNDF